MIHADFKAKCSKQKEPKNINAPKPGLRKTEVGLGQRKRKKSAEDGVGGAWRETAGGQVTEMLEGELVTRKLFKKAGKTLR